MAFTVEPGLYFRPGSCPRAPDLEGIGIRIEDDVLIDGAGAEVLTRATCPPTRTRSKRW